jgi:hypothetical protein
MPVTVTAAPLATIEAGEGELVQSREYLGRVRVARFTYTNTTGGTLAAGSKFRLVKLPANRVIVLGRLSNLKHSALGASRVAKIGHEAYISRANVPVAEGDDALATGLDLATAGVKHMDGNIATADTQLAYDSRDGVVLFATITGGTIPNGATIKGEVYFVTD